MIYALFSLSINTSLDITNLPIFNPLITSFSLSSIEKISCNSSNDWNLERFNPVVSHAISCNLFILGLASFIESNIFPLKIHLSNAKESVLMLLNTERSLSFNNLNFIQLGLSGVVNRFSGIRFVSITISSIFALGDTLTLLQSIPEDK